MNRMRTLTVQDLVRMAAERFQRQYSGYFGRPGSLSFLGVRDPEDVYKALLTVSTAAEVESILNDSWTRIECDECRCRVEVVVQLGTSSEDEYGPASYCLRCLESAVACAKEVNAS